MRSGGKQVKQKITRFTAVMYENQIEDLDSIDTNRAAANRRCVDRYFFLVNNAASSLQAKLNEDEISDVADLFTNFGFSENDLATIPKHFHDSIRIVSESRGGAVGPDLVDKLSRLSIDEKFALIHEAERRQKA